MKVQQQNLSLSEWNKFFRADEHCKFQPVSVLQIRRGNRDNLGIIFHMGI